jgi:hypothetical protein
VADDFSQQIKVFALKTLILFAAIFTFFILILLYINANLKTGPEFWGKFEEQIYRAADEPDLPPEKKEKILEALRKISKKYQPFIDALKGQ